MINKALDLPFDDPPETYSSSENFLHDMGIPPGTRGRIVPEGTVRTAPRTTDRSGRTPDGRSGARSARETAESSAKEDRPARSRNRRRRRTRGGKSAGESAAS
jgi:hypothetical protein